MGKEETAEALFCAKMTNVRRELSEVRKAVVVG